MDEWRFEAAPVVKTREGLVADQLRQAILRGHFKPGDKLDQIEIAESLNVSRSPLREALRTLAAEGLVTMTPYRGAVVTELSVAELEEILHIRSLLEGAAARRAAPMMTPARLTTLVGILEKAEKATNPEETLVLNNEFHLTIYSTVRQPRLLGMIQSLRNTVAPYNRLYLENPGRRERAWADHRRIYEACVKRDGEVAELETKRHLQQVFNGMLSALESSRSNNV